VRRLTVGVVVASGSCMPTFTGFCRPSHVFAVVQDEWMRECTECCSFDDVRDLAVRW